MSNISLYNLTEDFRKLMECDEDDGITNALIDIVSGDIEAKAANFCQFLATLDGTIEQFKAEEKRISSARKALEHKHERAREYMKQALLNAGIEKVSAGTFKVSVSMTAGSLVIDDPKAVPARYCTVIPEQHVPDKAAIKAAIKAGDECKYAHIEAGTSLRIV